jgi:hypothetical protein
LTIILLFTGIFWSGNVIKIDGFALQANQTHSISAKDAFYFSSMEFLGRSPPQNLHILGSYEYLTVIEALTGWILMALFLVTLSKVMLR